MSKVIAYCEKHPSERLNLQVEPKPLEHKIVIQVKQCEYCIEEADIKLMKLVAVMEEIQETHEHYLEHDKLNIDKIYAAVQEANGG